MGRWVKYGRGRECARFELPSQKQGLGNHVVFAMKKVLQRGKLCRDVGIRQIEEGEIGAGLPQEADGNECQRLPKWRFG